MGGVHCQVLGAVAVRGEGVTGLDGSQLWDLASQGARSAVCLHLRRGLSPATVVQKHTTGASTRHDVSVEVLCKFNY